MLAGGLWLAISEHKLFKMNKKDPIYLIVTALIFWMLILAIMSDNKWISLFGVNGRSTGILFYIALFVFFFWSRVFELKKQIAVFQIFLVIGTISMFYGLLQQLKIDPFKWDLVYRGIIGLFGNPNFMGAFSALIGIASFSLAANPISKPNIKILGLVIFSVSISNIRASHALQGYISLLIGITPIIIYRLHQKNPNLAKVFSFISGVGLISFVLSLFKIGPLTDLIYKQSVSYRGEFWRTAIRMMENQPIFGVGFERFGVNYRLYRDLPQVLRNGVDSYSDNAHNIYLQFAATGGVLLALLYLIFNCLVALKLVKKIQKNIENRFFYISIFAIWIAIQAQSLISVDTPAIAFWGMIFAGIICSEGIQSSKSKSDLRLSKVFGIVGVIAFSVLFVFQFNSQTKMRNAFYAQIPVANNDYWNAKMDLLNQAAKYEPLNPEWRILAANSLIQDKAYQQTIEQASKAVKLDKSDYRGWFFLATAYEESGKRDKAIPSRLTALKLDPYNTNNMLELVKDYKSANQLTKAKEIVDLIKNLDPSGNDYKQAIALIQ